MAVKKQKLGPGLLTLGKSGSSQEFGAQVTKVAVEPSWSDGDKIYVLSGDTDEEEGEFEGKLTGEFYQDYDMKSLVAWTWEHTGETVPFVFTPRSDAGMTLEGDVKVRAVNIGGDVEKENTAEFEWNISRLPKLKPTTAGGGK